MPNEETIEQAVMRMRGIDLNEFVRLIEDEINKRAFKKALEFTKPDNSVNVWVSWDDRGDDKDLWIGSRPSHGRGFYDGNDNCQLVGSATQGLCSHLNVKEGECKQFLITEVNDGN